MTCTHVLALVDSLPLAECPPHQLAAAERHARDCAMCQSTLAAAKALESGLSRLAEPVPPTGLAAVIIARTARIDETRAATARDAAQVAAATTRRDRPAWAAAIVGIAVGLGVQLYRLLSGELTLDLTSSRIGGGTHGLFETLHAGPAVLVLAAGLLLYLAGFFAPLRGTGTPGPPPAG